MPIIKAEIHPTVPDEPGYGVLRIRQWEGATRNIKAMLMHVGSGQQHLNIKDRSANWQTEPAWLDIPELSLENNYYVLVLPPRIIDPLLSVTGGSIRITLTTDIEDQNSYAIGAIKIVSGVLTSAASSTDNEPKHTEQTGSQGTTLGLTPAQFQEEHLSLNTHEAASLPPHTLDLAQEARADSDTVVVDQSSQEPAPAADVSESTSTALHNNEKDTSPLAVEENNTSKNTGSGPSQGKGITVALISVFLLMLLGGAGAVYWLLNKGTVPIDGPCTIASIGKESSVRNGVKTCLETQPKLADLQNLIKDAKNAELCDAVQLIYATRGRAGDKDMALAYAQEYDPKTHQGGSCFEQPDRATAAYWYQTVLEQDPNNQEAKERLKELES